MDFDYKKYSLEHLEEWLHDALDCEDVTPQEIYETIINAVDENIEYHKKYLTKNIEVLSLLKGNRSVDFEENYDGWDSQYTEEELNAMCDAAEDKEKCREYNLREAEYYDKRAQLDADYEAIKAAGGYDWTPIPSKDVPYPLYMNKKGEICSPDVVFKKDKVTKWRLPVEVDGLTGDCYVEFPEDLLAAANLEEGDQVEWVDQGDGSYLLRKV